LKIFTLFILLFFSAYVSANAKPEVLWLSDSQIDIDYFRSKEHISISVDTINLIVNSIDNYQIDLKLATIPRINALLRKDHNLCMVNRIKTKPREAYSYFSLPLNLFPGLRLYFLDNESNFSSQLLNKGGQLISLSDLFVKYPENVLGISKGRSYGERLDKKISAIEADNLYIRSGSNQQEAIIEMLLKNRIDYIIDYPVEVNSMLNKLKRPIKLKSVGIAGSDKFILGRLACGKTKRSLELLSSINASLRELYKSSQFYEAHQRYLDKSDMAQFDQYYKEVFVNTENNIYVPSK